MTRWHIEPEDEEYEEDETDEWGNPIQHLNPEVGDEDDDPERDDGPAFVPAAKAYETADGDIRALRRMPYSRYLETLHWRITRRRALLRAGYRCKRCEATRPLEVHHLSYDRLGAEAEADLMVLCGPCHEAEHADPNRNALVVSREMALYANAIVEMVASVLRGEYADSRDCQGCGYPVVGQNRACSHCGRSHLWTAPVITAEATP
jgi:hypothetical protein